MDRFEAMALFREVVDHGSFSAASRALKVPVPTLSRKVADLEALLGAQLLVRTTRRLALTEAGASYLAAARHILNQVNEAEREVAGEFEHPKGELVVTAPVHFGRRHVLPLVAGFLASFPAITARLLLVDRTVDLVDADVDVAVRIGRLPDSTLVVTRVGSMRTVVCASPGLLDRHGTPQSPADLRDMPIVAAEGPLSNLVWRFGQAGTQVTQVVAPRLSVTTTDAAALAAVEGIGATQLLHYQVADAVAAGRLRIILDAFEPEPLPIHLLHAERGRLPLKVRRFLDHIAPPLRARFGPNAGVWNAEQPTGVVAEG